MSLDKISSSPILRETVFLKEFKKDYDYVNFLENKLKQMNNKNSEEAKQIQKNIYGIKRGIYGESTVNFELKNSFLPMLCFHDLRLKNEKGEAQIDFLILTKKFIYILETKNYNGDIEITKDGSFIRRYEYKGKITEEVIESPVSQCSRHKRVLEKFLLDNNILTIENFPIKSIAVFTNDKNKINKDNAPENISSLVYRRDQLVHFLKQELDSSEYGITITDSAVYQMGEEILNIHNSNSYKKPNGAKNANITENKIIIKDVGAYNIDNFKDNQICKDIRQYRFKAAQQKGCKPYELFINNDVVLMMLNKIETKQDLLEIGLKPEVVDAHGSEILKILSPVNNSPELNNVSTANFNKDEKLKDIKEKLKKYRRETAYEKNVMPRDIFDNDSLERLLGVRPRTMDELFEIKGFDNRDIIAQYGKDILEILHDNAGRLL